MADTGHKGLMPSASPKVFSAKAISDRLPQSVPPVVGLSASDMVFMRGGKITAATYRCLNKRLHVVPPPTSTPRPRTSTPTRSSTTRGALIARPPIPGAINFCTDLGFESEGVLSVVPARCIGDRSVESDPRPLGQCPGCIDLSHRKKTCIELCKPGFLSGGFMTRIDS